MTHRGRLTGRSPPTSDGSGLDPSGLAAECTEHPNRAVARRRRRVERHDAVRAVVERHQVGIRKLSKQIIAERAALPAEPLLPSDRQRPNGEARRRMHGDRHATRRLPARLKGIGIPLRRHRRHDGR